MLRQNPHNVHEWHKRVHLFPENPTRQILVYTEAVKTVDSEKARAQMSRLASRGMYTAVLAWILRCNCRHMGPNLSAALKLGCSLVLHPSAHFGHASGRSQTSSLDCRSLDGFYFPVG